MATTFTPIKPQNTPSDKGRDITEKAKETASSFAETAKDAGSNLLNKAKDTASDLGHKAEDATHAVGSGMRTFAGTVRDSMPKEGVVGAAASSVASGLETSGRYLEKEGLSGIGEDVTNLIRNNPIPAMLVGIGLGFLIARATSAITRS